MFKKTAKLILACSLVIVTALCPFFFDAVLALEERTIDCLTSTADEILSTNDEVTASRDEINGTDAELETTVSIEETSNIEETTIIVEESTTYNNTTESTTESVAIPENLVYIKGTNSITVVSYTGGDSELIIPDTIEGLSVTTIGKSAFKDCSNLNSITLPKSITKIEAWAFQNCIGLNSVKISDIKSWCKIDFTNTYSNPLYYAENLYLNNELIEDLIIPTGVSTISDYSFINGSFYSVTIPKSVNTIGAWAFEDCTGLDSVNISDIKRWCKIDFTNTYSNPLNYAENLYINGELVDELIIPNDVSTIYDYAFINGNFHSVIIPRSIKSIGAWAFEDCTNLMEVFYYGDYNNWNRINISLGNECLTNSYIHFDVIDSTVWTDITEILSTSTQIAETTVIDFESTEVVTVVTDPAETTVTESVETTSIESTESAITEPTEYKPVETTVTESVESEATSIATTVATDNATEPTGPFVGGESKPTDPTEPSTPDETKRTEPSEDKGVLGDVNGDGKVNVKDATLVQKAVAKIIELTDEEKLRADVNADNKNNVKDATVIQKFAAKLETGFPVGEPIVSKNN